MFRLSAVARLVPGLAACAFLLSACTNPDDFDEPMPDLGDFSLGHNIVVASKMKKVAISRDASEEEWVAAMTEAIDERFGRYEGDKLYHLGISVEGYILAPPGIPLVLSPKSGLIVNVTVWDDAAGGKINEEPRQFTVLESFSGETVVGSGLTQTREEQMTNLARNAAKQIENWLLENREWFGDAPGPQAGQMRPAPVAAATVAGSVAAEDDGSASTGTTSGGGRSGGGDAPSPATGGTGGGTASPAATATSGGAGASASGG
ncbi:hypothetical protein PSM7751_03905 [Pseudooceanicola marinus]|uniref:Lipoprotein n=1 Tax=Pseudooceanicola marinus TaxID=396013 RepID=A0A1X7A7H0_9RHOB|nr:hypothetical protein [Pseudooceanicola marinus]SLN72017.1 hypothetical protein PSM7751_03905 [Pseudooceanicola marinus]